MQATAPRHAAAVRGARDGIHLRGVVGDSTQLRGVVGERALLRGGLFVVLAIATALLTWALTASGYANGYYAQAALAASRSWTALLTNAADQSALVSLDKGPLSDWMMGLSGRVFGFSSLSLLLPDAACGLAAVAILHDAVRRAFGGRAALLAALMLALSPVSVVIGRYDNPDALLALLLVASAWALLRALESGRLRHVLLCGALVGLAFNTKMLEAYLIVPGLAGAFLLAARGSLRRRVAQLLAGGAVMLAVSVGWYATMTLIAPADRPYVGETTDDSWFQLILDGNGLKRVLGFANGGQGASGPLRLFSTAAYSIATVGFGRSGSNPTAGPQSLTPTRDLAGASARALERGLLAYLEAHRGGARYLVAATGSDSAAPIGLATRAPVITLGGFDGGDPAPTAPQLQALVRSGELRYVLLTQPDASPAALRRARWVSSHCARTALAALYRCWGTPRRIALAG